MASQKPDDHSEVSRSSNQNTKSNVFLCHGIDHGIHPGQGRRIGGNPFCFKEQSGWISQYECGHCYLEQNHGCQCNHCHSAWRLLRRLTSYQIHDGQCNQRQDVVQRSVRVRLVNAINVNDLRCEDTEENQWINQRGDFG
eukprot:2998576-Amphidinium_carterae.2